MIVSSMIVMGVNTVAADKTEPTAADGALSDSDIASAITAGTGTVNINGINDLYALAAYANANDAKLAGIKVQLNADITVNENLNATEITSSTDLSSLRAWAPIESFAGTFDGGNHVIKGLYIYDAIGAQGFFANLANGAKVQNVTFEDCYVTQGGASHKNSAVVAGESASGAAIEMRSITVRNCHVYRTGMLNDAAGIIAFTQGSVIIDDCHMIGGKIQNLYTTDNGQFRTGAMIGLAAAGAKITNCTNSASVTGNGATGGIIGRANASVTIEDCVNTGDVISGGTHQTSQNTFAAGIYAQAQGGPVYITRCTNSGKVTCNVGGTAHGTGRAAGIFCNYGVATGEVVIKDCVNTSTGTVKALGTMAGGICAFVEATTNLQFVNCVNYASVTVDSNNTANNHYAGGIIGRFCAKTGTGNESMKNCVNYGDITCKTGATGHAGGLIGQGTQVLTVSDCVNTGNVWGKNKTGGLVGLYDIAEGSFTNCIVTGTVYSDQNQYSNGVLIGAGSVQADNKYITFASCYYVKDLNSAKGMSASTNAAMAKYSAASAKSGSFKFIYPEKNINGATFVGGVDNTSNNIDTNQALYNAMFNDPSNSNYTGACRNEVSELCGIDGAVLLTAAGFDFGSVWYVTEGVPVPTRLALSDKEVDKEADVVYKGYQQKIDNTGDTLSIRLVAGLDELSYVNTGFEVYVLENGAVKTTPDETVASVVYTSLNQYSSEGELLDPVTAEALGSKYLSAIIVNGIPTSDASIKLALVPYVTNPDGSVAKGSAAVMVIVGGEIVEQYVM